MKLVLAVSLFLLVVCALATTGMTKEKEKGKGEELFKKHCVACHPDGKNIVNPKKTLYKKDLEASKIKTTEDIMKVLRNPGPGMIKFDEKTISEKDAREIAEYIMKTFK